MSDSEKSAKELLEGAYALETPEDNVSYYRDFARHYDSSFAEGMGYQLPQLVAQTYLSLATAEDQPIADLGCGTGLVAESLPAGVVIDGLDISEDMLAVAGTKDLYRSLSKLDLTKSIPRTTPLYQCVLSSGTFTHGHLGPDAMENALTLGNVNALFVFSVNSEHFRNLGFDQLLNTLKNRGQISELTLKTHQIYTEIGHDHAKDTALICSFRKLCP